MHFGLILDELMLDNLRHEMLFVEDSWISNEVKDEL